MSQAQLGGWAWDFSYGATPSFCLLWHRQAGLAIRSSTKVYGGLAGPDRPLFSDLTSTRPATALSGAWAQTLWFTSCFHSSLGNGCARKFRLPHSFKTLTQKAIQSTTIAGKVKYSHLTCMHLATGLWVENALRPFFIIMSAAMP